jgi:hypothetical protein
MVELVVVVGVLCVLGMIVFSDVIRSGPKARRIHCTGNLKQIGAAMRLFATDLQGRFPMEVAAAEGGSRDVLYAGTANANPLLEFHPFYTSRNELGTPMVLACPADRARGFPRMSNWVGVAFPGGLIPAGGGTNANDFAQTTADWKQGRGNKAVSYTIGLEAEETKPNMILATDRNLRYTGQVDVANSPVGLDPRLVRRGQAQASLGWGANIHGPNGGNILLTDGSVQQTSDARLREQIEANLEGSGTNVTVTTNWLLFPVINGEQTKW